MDFVQITSAAATVTTLIVAIFKRACPAASSLRIVLVALIAGQWAAFMFLINGGAVITRRELSGACLAGIVATATAMGVRSADNGADEKREEAKG